MLSVDDTSDENQHQIDIQHSDDRGSFEGAYFSLMAKLETAISEFNIREAQTDLGSRNSNTQLNNDTSVSQICLPKIELPSFSGINEDWYSFYDTFEKLIHSNCKLAAVQKFHYLRSSLKGEALDIIKSIDITTENYVEDHVRQLVELPHITRENHVQLRTLLSNALKHLRALKALERPVDTWDDLIIHLISSKLDPVTKREWETSRTDNSIPTFKQLKDFLLQRCSALEAIASKTTGAVSSIDTNTLNQKPKRAVNYAASTNVICECCKECHFLYQCNSFKELPVDKRFKIVKNARLCINCLKTSNHQVKNCTSGFCRKCSKAHNTLLHFENAGNQDETDLVSNAEISQAPVVTQCSQQGSARKVLLSTAIVHIFDAQGKSHTCRALLDNGSQLNFITETLANKLRLKQQHLNIAISGVAQGGINARRSVNVLIQSKQNSYRERMECVILQKITQNLPQEFVDRSQLKIPSNISLADPHFNIPDNIDLLIGAEVFWQLLCIGQIKSCRTHSTIQKTKLGWIISGQIFNNHQSNKSHICHLATMDDLNNTISKFWQIENNYCNENFTLSPEERECETQFLQTTTRNSDGRYIVKLLIKEELMSQLGNSKEIAKRRFYALERRLAKQPDIYVAYRNFMNEYQSLIHMQEVKDITDDGYDLFAILARFRTFAVAITADITKMYRQVLIHPTQRSLQRIFWRDNPQEDLKIFELMTVTYGTAAAPFLAIRALRKLAEDEASDYPLSSKIVLRDFYVDDMLTGAKSIDEAMIIKQQTHELLKRGGFELTKWCSEIKLRDNKSLSDNKEFNARESQNETRALGVVWNYDLDIFKFVEAGRWTPFEKPTKRNILSRTALIFDPLGFIGPVTLTGKIIMQELWLLKIDWDESIPMNLNTTWKEYESQLEQLNDVKISRRMLTENPVYIELHGFADASQQAYGACVYMRSISESGQVESHLIASKSWIAPVKSLSIPRLELCGALVLAQLVDKLKNCLNCKIDNTVYWTDSNIVLCWLQAPNRIPYISTIIDKLSLVHRPAGTFLQMSSFGPPALRLEALIRSQPNLAYAYGELPRTARQNISPTLSTPTPPTPMITNNVKGKKRKIREFQSSWLDLDENIFKE
ncbi:PREDICTED: uncharacterized protein LOC108769219 [Trachymyrmex cornetzi]|uniref:uncharacterized protein LOC108769219 n=1 Tax=Trachymyrmex cornetzi TaxID=471704 RepID=UPI00084F4F6F|nr:PREDICTED: uncharacterized protein LOC108769219 [Trachymyrmex cornetzi]